MTTKEAAIVLATYALTGSVRETARQLGRSPSDVSRKLKAAGAAVKPEPASFQGTKKGRKPLNIDWAAAFGSRNVTMLGIVDEKMHGFRPRELIGAIKIFDDARYREEHPESVRGGDGSQVIVPVQIVIKSDKNI